MFTGSFFGEDWQRRTISGLFRATRWNQYLANWPVVLNALHRLWEMGKVSELRSPFYEPFENPANK
jgi:hypothetical protein